MSANAVHKVVFGHAASWRTGSSPGKTNERFRATYLGNSLKPRQRIAREVAAFLDDEFQEIRRTAFRGGDRLLDGADDVGRLLDPAGGSITTPRAPGGSSGPPPRGPVLVPG